MCLFITEHRVSNWPWPGTGRLQLCHGRHLIRHNLQVLPGHTRADPDQRENLRAHEPRPKGPTGREANRPRLWGCHVWRWRQWLQCPQGRPCRNLAVGGGGVRGRALHLQGIQYLVFLYLQIIRVQVFYCRNFKSMSKIWTWVLLHIELIYRTKTNLFFCWRVI